MSNERKKINPSANHASDTDRGPRPIHGPHWASPELGRLRMVAAASTWRSRIVNPEALASLSYQVGQKVTYRSAEQDVRMWLGLLAKDWGEHVHAGYNIGPQPASGQMHIHVEMDKPALASDSGCGASFWDYTELDRAAFAKNRWGSIRGASVDHSTVRTFYGAFGEDEYGDAIGYNLRHPAMGLFVGCPRHRACRRRGCKLGRNNLDIALPTQ